MMRRIFCLLLVVFAVVSPAQAQIISPYPYCATFKNETEGSVFGSIRTHYAPDLKGKPQRHEGSFRLAKGATTEVCSTGPFYPGYQVEFLIKTMIPVFSCKTVLQGTITITSKRDATGRNIYDATCRGPLLMPR